jgi:hypothetical protein
MLAATMLILPARAERIEFGAEEGGMNVHRHSYYASGEVRIVEMRQEDIELNKADDPNEYLSTALRFYLAHRGLSLLSR